MSYLFLFLVVYMGFLIVYLLKPSQKFIRLLLAFSGAYLLSVTILHLLPEVYTANSDHKSVGIFILIGIVLQSVLESFSKGAEHGHIHVHEGNKEFPTLLFVSLCIHAFSEGLPVHNTDSNLLWAIIVHKIPIAIVLTSFLILSKYSLKQVVLLISIFAIMSPLGVFLGDEFVFFKTYAQQITSLIIGVFLHISTIILFESNENHKFNIKKFTAILMGILLTLFTL